MRHTHTHPGALPYEGWAAHALERLARVEESAKDLILDGVAEVSEDGDLISAGVQHTTHMLRRARHLVGRQRGTLRDLSHDRTEVAAITFLLEFFLDTDWGEGNETDPEE